MFKFYLKGKLKVNKELLLSAEKLRKILYYKENSGKFTWVEFIGSRSKKGTVAGHKTTNGYIGICISHKTYLAHRLAWLYKTGKWPSLDIDHKDGNKTNNKWNNLRLATKTQNMQNRTIHKNSTSGYKGVFFTNKSKVNSWYSMIRVEGKLKYLGGFRDAPTAYEAYLKASLIYFKEFSRPSKVEHEKEQA